MGDLERGLMGSAAADPSAEHDDDDE